MTELDKKLISAFLKYKQRKGFKSLVFQSLPQAGVWIDGELYLYETILKQCYQRIGESNENSL